MHRLLLLVLGVLLAPLSGMVLAPASELDGKPAASGRAEPPAQSIAREKTEGVCGSHGTQVDFLDTPRAAAKLAKKEQRLVFVLHVSGNFEDPRFT
jgi:hypothetical protein